MSKNAQNHINEIIKKERMYYLDLCNRDLTGDMNLGEFTNLKSINASNNKFTNLDFLNSLPNKDKLESINFFGNQISEIDFNALFTNFPNLKVINLDNNPLSLNNLEQLSADKLTFFVDNVESKKIKISSWKGSIITDLLKTIQQLKAQLAGTRGVNTTHRHEIPLQQQVNYQQLPAKPSNNFGLLVPIVGISLIVGSLFTFIYLKNKKKTAKYE